jgi:hypothetical protein
MIYPDSLLSNPFSNALSLSSAFRVRDQVTRPYKTRGKIIDANHKSAVVNVGSMGRFSNG